MFTQLEELNKRIDILSNIAFAQLEELRLIRLSSIPFNKDNLRQWDVCMNWVAAEVAKRKADEQAAILKQAKENQAMLNEGKADGK